MSNLIRSTVRPCFGYGTQRCVDFSKDDMSESYRI